MDIFAKVLREAEVENARALVGRTRRKRDIFWSLGDGKRGIRTVWYIWELMNGMARRSCVFVERLEAEL